MYIYIYIYTHTYTHTYVCVYYIYIYTFSGSILYNKFRSRAETKHPLESIILKCHSLVTHIPRSSKRSCYYEMCLSLCCLIQQQLDTCDY